MRGVPEGLDETSPIFSIAAAAELAGLHAQTLRQYDRLGLVEPARTAGNTRRYSMRDVGRLRQVQLLSAEGVSLEGIRRILELENQVMALQHRVSELTEELSQRRRSETSRVFAAGLAGDVVTLARGQRPRPRSQALMIWRGDPAR
jgi:MerR family transcriptional regulator/heat shock protein HspR